MLQFFIQNTLTEQGRYKYADEKRHGEYKGRRDSGGGYDRNFQQACFYCKEVGHRISDCPKKQNKNQRNGQNYKNNRNDSNQFSQRNKKEKDNFVYEDNCPPPDDEDWGGGTDSEEEKKRLKKEQKKLKKLQQQQQQLENQQEIQNEQNDIQKNADQGNQDWQQQQFDQNQQIENQNDFEEDWGGNDEKNIYVKQEHQNDNQMNFEMSIEDQIKAQFGGAFAIHQSRNVEGTEDQNEQSDLRDKKSYDQQEKSSDYNYEKKNDYIRNSSRERDRDRSREKSYKQDIDYHHYSKSYDRYNKHDDQIHKKDYDKSKRDYDKHRDDRRNSETDYKHKSDREKYHRSDRSYNQDKNRNNGYRDKDSSLRDNSYRIKQERISEEKFQKFAENHKDDITNQIDQMLNAKAQGLINMNFFSKVEENEQENERKDDDYEEWTLESLQKDQEKQNSYSSRNKSYSRENNNENYSSKNKSSYQDDNWGLNVENKYNRDEYNNGFRKSEGNGYYNKYSSNATNKKQYSNNSQKQQDAIVIISDDENDPWESPKKNKKTTQNKKQQSPTYNKPSQKKSLQNLVNSSNNALEESPVYEPNLNFENETTKSKDPLLYNPDKENKTTVNKTISEFNQLAIENIFDFEQQQQRELFSNCIKFYDQIPSESFRLGYDRHSSMFKEKLMNFLNPVDGNCLKVYEGDLKMKKYTDQGSLSISIKTQVYTNHSWNEVKWIPSLRILRQKDKIKEFQSIDFSTGASQLSLMIPKDNYERIFYLYWIEGQSEEDEQKIEDYSNYLYEKKLLSGVNLETGCYTMASFNQIFPEVESYMRNSDFKKKTPIKLVLIFNPELGYQVSYKSVPF
ncbi:hypothetical protein ABPG74_010717 [Tetrahymena malaccensis]